MTVHAHLSQYVASLLRLLKPQEVVTEVVVEASDQLSATAKVNFAIVELRLVRLF